MFNAPENFHWWPLGRYVFADGVTGQLYMQDIKFIIRTPERMSWHPVILEIEKNGFQVESDIKDADVTVILSGTYLNPMVFGGRKILVAHSQEWGTMWDVLYKEILSEYYDEILDIKTIPLDRIMDKIRGKIEASEPGSSH
jgi:hypothetical protein